MRIMNHILKPPSLLFSPSETIDEFFNSRSYELGYFLHFCPYNGGLLFVTIISPGRSILN